MSHKATPEQWADAGAFASDTRACILELRDRIAALEQRPIPGTVWFDAIGYGATASILRQEVKRG